MKLPLVASLVLLSCLSCSSSEQWNSEYSESQFEIKRDAQRGVGIKLLDLNDDVLRLILDQMDFVGLVKLKPVHSSLTALAKASFRERYRDYRIIISSGKTDETLYREFPHAKTLLVQDFELAVIC